MIYQAMWMVTRYYFTLSSGLHYHINVKFYITQGKAIWHVPLAGRHAPLDTKPYTFQ